jgi:alpha-tubulin suppressor-like RCC1 family protein
MRRFGRLGAVVAILVGVLGAASGAHANGAQPAVVASDVVSWGNVHYSEAPAFGPSGGIAIASDDEGGLLVLKKNGTVVGWNAPNPPAGLTGVTKIAASCGMYLALKSDGTVVGWNSLAATPVPAGLTGVTNIFPGCGFAMALKSNGTVVAWGKDDAGQTDVPAGLSGVTAIATAGYTLALKSNGTVVAWGAGAPAVPAGLSNVVAVSAGSGFALALKSNGTVAAWGSDTTGTALPAGLTGVASVTATSNGYGTGMGFAVKTNGTVVAWGSDGSCDAGVMPHDLSHVVSLVTDGQAAAVIKSDGTVETWGNNCTAFERWVPNVSGVVAEALGGGYGYALTADGTVLRAGGYALSTEEPANLEGATTIDAGSRHDLAFMGDGSVVAWGDDAWGQLDLPSDFTGVTRISAGGSLSFGLKSDGTVVYLNTDTWSGTDPYAPPAGLSGVTAIDAGGTLGDSYVLARKSNGTVVAWGDQGSGATTVPTGLTGVTAVSAGGDCALALKSDHTVVGWPTWCPAVPAGLTGVTAIAAGGNFNLALKSDHTVVAWGTNDKGQTKVPAGLTNVTAIAAGSDFALALKSNGTVVGWGNDDQGQIDIPAGLRGVTAITAGDDFASALFSGAPAAASATVSGVATPRTVGVTSAITISVKDGSGKLAYGYRGTIHFTSSDPAATLPSNYTFTGADRGSHVFLVTLSTPGTQSVTATDTVTSSLHGAQSGIGVAVATAPGAPTRANAVAGNGSATASWIAPVSSGGSVITSYVVTSNPGGATCTTRATSCRVTGLLNGRPYTFTVRAANAAGTGPSSGASSAVIPGTPGAPDRVTATPSKGAALVSWVAPGFVGASAIAGFTVTASPGGRTCSITGLTNGTPYTFTVTAHNSAGTGPASSPSKAAVPSSATHLLVSVTPLSVTAGTAFNLVVKATDAGGHIATDYRGTIHITTSDPWPYFGWVSYLPSDYTFTAADAGTHTFKVTLVTAGTQSVTATDTVAKTIKGSQTGIVVKAGVVKTLTVSGLTTPRTKGVAGTIRVTAVDAYGNRVSGYTGTVHFTSSDTSAKLPANYKFKATDAGTHVFSVTLKTAGTQSVTATDTVTKTIKGIQTGIVVK